MSTSYRVQAVATIRAMDAVYSFLAAPPVSWVILASDMNLDPDTAIQGRYVEAGDGVVQGVWMAKVQDTYIAGTAGRTGRAFLVYSGTWHDDLNERQADCYALAMLDSSPGVTWEVRSQDITGQIEAADIVIKRGVPPAGEASARTQTGYTCYLELAYGSTDNTGYRIALEWGQPIRLDYTPDGVTWKAAAIAKSLGSTERYLAANGGIVRVRVLPDTTNAILVVEIGDAGYLRHVSPTGLLPAPGRIRLSGQNGSVRMNYFPLRAQPLQVSGSIDTGRYQPNGGNAFVNTNSLGTPPATQTTTGSVTTGDNQSFAWAVGGETPDAGDGLGGSDTPVLADVTLVIPACWVDSIAGIPDLIGGEELPVRSVDELQVWDDATRTFVSSALVSADNQYGRFSGAIGHRAIDISAGIGGPYYSRFSGIAGASLEGIDLATLQTWGRMGLPCRGSEFKMQHAAAQRRLYDGWCLYSAVRFECELGNVHPRFLMHIPLYVPPGATAEAPYGEAGNDCPYPILARGTGMAARYDFGPEMTPWDVLQILVQESGLVDPATLQSLPFYMGFTVDKQFHFEAFNPGVLTPVIYYSDVDPSGQGQIITEFHMYNSIAQMRSRIDFQGIDSVTYELLVAHLTMPIPVLQAIGFDYPWLERNARYDAGYIQQMAQVAGQIASQPQQVVKFKAPFRPDVYAGQKCYVQEKKSLGGVGEFLIIELRSRYGMQQLVGNSGHRDCYSLITARSTTEYP